jgi:hypothetical protein
VVELAVVEQKGGVPAMRTAALWEKKDKLQILLVIRPPNPRPAQVETVLEQHRSLRIQREATNPLHVINASHLPHNQWRNQGVVLLKLNRTPPPRLEILCTSASAYQIAVTIVIRISNEVKISQNSSQTRYRTIFTRISRCQVTTVERAIRLREDLTSLRRVPCTTEKIVRSPVRETMFAQIVAEEVSADGETTSITQTANRILNTSSPMGTHPNL